LLLPLTKYASVTGHNGRSTCRTSQNPDAASAVRGALMNAQAHAIKTLAALRVTAPRLPCAVGKYTLLSLGTLLHEPRFRWNSYVYPAGYAVSRMFRSTRTPDVEVPYRCEILQERCENGDGHSPVFRVRVLSCAAHGAQEAWHPPHRTMRTDRTSPHWFQMPCIRKRPELLLRDGAPASECITTNNTDTPGSDVLEH
jgi:hypothetical protein